MVRVRSDNISALYMVLKCKAKSPALSIVAREIAMDQARSLYEFTLLKHINTKDNLIADALSRQFEPIPVTFPELGIIALGTLKLSSCMFGTLRSHSYTC